MRIDRMLAITVMLLNRDRISARELADRFEVSVRTIYRDIDALNMAGIPVVSYAGNNGGFGIMDNYRLDRQLLTVKDMTAILSALKGISDTLDYRELDGAIEKISSLVPRNENGPRVSPAEQLVVDILPWGYRKKQKLLLRTINDAVQKCRLMAMLYRNTQGESVLRTVEPMTLIFKGHAWYLFAFCRIKGDFRIFRLSRMSDVTVLDETFTRRAASHEDYMEPESVPGMMECTLKFSPRMRVYVEDYYEPEQISYRENGEMIVRVSYPGGDWMSSMILSYGENVEVLEPEGLRDAIGKKAQSILKIYQKSGAHKS